MALDAAGRVDGVVVRPSIADGLRENVDIVIQGNRIASIEPHRAHRPGVRRIETHPQAPKTVAAFLKLLPYRQKLIHVRWSGEGVWVPLGDFELGVRFGNHTSHPSIGDILFYPGGYSETEIILACGSCSFSSEMGQLAGNHFLTIVEGKEQLPALGRKVLWEGAQDVSFELDA